MRVRNKHDNREGEARIPLKGTVLPPGDERGFILNGTDWAVEYDDGKVHIYSPEAFEMVFDKVKS